MIEKTIVRADTGIRFHNLSTDRFKMSRLSFNFVLPADAAWSPRTKLMLAVMMRGCRKYPSVISINKKLDELYGATVTWRAVSAGDKHVFKISCEMLSNKYRFAGDNESVVRGVAEIVLDILFDTIKDENGLLSRSNFESEKKLAIDAIRAKINDQKAYSAEQCRNLMFDGTSEGISVDGTEEQITAMTLEEVSEGLERFLKNAMLECYYVGSDCVEDVEKMVYERFSALGRSVDMLGEEKPLERDINAEIRSKNEVMQVTQSRLNIGLVGGAVMKQDGYHATCLFNEILGGSSVAKLFMNVREKQSLCYYCYSAYGSATGTFMISCGIKKENREKAYLEIKRQLDEMRSGSFSEEDLVTAKRAVISGLCQISDSPAAIEAFKFRRILAGVSESVEECVERLNKVSREDIISVAEKIRIDTVYFLSGEGEEEDEDYE